MSPSSMSPSSSSPSNSNNPQAHQKPYQPTPDESGHGKEPSGPKGDDPSTAGPGSTKVQSGTPENRLGHINPSAPEDSNVTPGSMNEK